MSYFSLPTRKSTVRMRPVLPYEVADAGVVGEAAENSRVSPDHHTVVVQPPAGAHSACGVSDGTDDSCGEDADVPRVEGALDEGGAPGGAGSSSSPRPAMATEMYQKQARRFHEAHRLRQMPEADAVSLDTGDSSVPPSRGAQLGGGAAARHQSFFPRHRVVKDPQARAAGESMEDVLGRMSYRYRQWQNRLAAAPCPTRVTITAWNQAVFKYVFHDAFDSNLDIAELQAQAALFGSVLINMAVVIYNVLNVPAYNYLSTRIAAQVVFTVECVLVSASFICLLLTVLHAFVKRKITTGFAVDLVYMARFVGEFSVLQSSRLLSPVLVVTYVLPFVTEARNSREYARGAIILILWCVGVFGAALCLVIKVSQVKFAAEVSFEDWTWQNYLVMVGLLLNISKIDTSYDSVSVALLEAIHQNFIGPGGVVVSKVDKSRSLFAKMMRLVFGVQHDALYTVFGKVFNLHFGGNDVNEADMTTRQRLRKVANFISFVAKLDNRMLERYLEMISSPKLHYQIGREIFAECHATGDVSGMEMAVYLCDPLSDDAYRMEAQYPFAFQIDFVCQDD